MPICIYHKNCADGFASAVIVRRALNNRVTIFPGVYGDPPPPNLYSDHIYIVDFSYPKETIIEMANKADKITIIDHHKTAIQNLVDLPDNVEVIFDISKSGAVLTWEYFFNSQSPLILSHIQDRDLWNFNLKFTREVMAYLFSHEYDFDKWDKFIFHGVNFEKAIREGSAIERKRIKDIKEFIRAASYRTLIDGYDIPILNAPYMWASDAGHIMCEGEHFAAVYYYETESRIAYSLRSDRNGLDVSEIAKKFGGGGHKHAAGFRLDIDNMRDISSS